MAFLLPWQPRANGSANGSGDPVPWTRADASCRQSKTRTPKMRLSQRFLTANDILSLEPWTSTWMTFVLSWLRSQSDPSIMSLPTIAGAQASLWACVLRVVVSVVLRLRMKTRMMALAAWLCWFCYFGCPTLWVRSRQSLESLVQTQGRPQGHGATAPVRVYGECKRLSWPLHCSMRCMRHISRGCRCHRHYHEIIYA